MTKSHWGALLQYLREASLTTTSPAAAQALSAVRAKMRRITAARRTRGYGRAMRRDRRAA